MTAFIAPCPSDTKIPVPNGMLSFKASKPWMDYFNALSSTGNSSVSDITALQEALAALTVIVNNIQVEEHARYCQGRLTLASGIPVYGPQRLTPASTNLSDETVEFSTPHGWVTGTIVSPNSTVGGLTQFVLYYVHVWSTVAVSFHTTLADAIANTSPVNLTASITAVILPRGMANTHIYFTPYNGNLVSLYNGSEWENQEFEEVDIDISALSTDTNYDVFVYDSGGLTSEVVAWSSASARATELVLFGGVYVQSGATGKRYIGTFRTVSAGATEDSWLKRFLWNNVNRTPLKMLVLESTSSWTYATPNNNAYRPANNSTANRVQFVVGLADAFVRAMVYNLSSSGSGGRTTSCGIGVDSTTANLGESMGTSVNATEVTQHHCSWQDYLTAGFHYLQWLEYGDVANVASIIHYGTLGAQGVVQSGLHASVDG